jgi:4-amino-4-deoxy-L-arabinose transferase-like glycosyltransferase
VSAFFWGQGYGGTQEVLATVPLVTLFGSSREVIRAVPLVCTGIAAVLVWRVGRRTVGEPAARIAAVFLWVWPPYLAWKSDRAHGFYGSGLVYVCLILFLVLRLSERRSRVDAALLGLVLGLGWWQTPQLLPVALPALAWLLWKQRDIWRDAWIVLPAAVLGALPWLISNFAHDWWSFDIDSGETPYATRLRAFFSATFPMALGLRIPFTSEWLLGPVLSAVAYAGLIALFAIAWWRRRSSPSGLLFVVAAGYPFLYALSPSTWLVDEPRYVVVLLPVVALLVAQALTTVPRAAVAIGASVVVSTLVLWHLTSSPAFVQRADGLFVPADFDPVIAELDRRGLAHVFASYWPAYRIDFETGERIVAAEAHIPSVSIERRRVVPRVPRRHDEIRHRAYDTIVRADPNAGYVLLRDAAEDDKARPVLERAGYVRSVVDGFAVYGRGTRR